MKQNRESRDVADKKRNKSWNQKTGLKLPNFSTRKEFIDYANTECKDYRATGKVVFIKWSLVFEKEQLCTIQMKSRKQITEKDIKFAQENKENCKSFIWQMEINFIPLNKSFKWPQSSSLPEEFWLDIKEKRSVNTRYYLMKFSEWNSKYDWPKAEITKSIG